MLGLPRALLAAGVQGVCATLWPIFDEAGPPVMTAMYEQLIAGRSPAEALRQAQLQQIATKVPPENWAGYVAIG